MLVEIRSRTTRSSIILTGGYESIKDCLEKNRGANLRGANLRGADFRGADIRDAKGYVNSHDVFAEAVRRQGIKEFVDAEWVAIAQITIHRLCWDSIEKRFPDVMPPIFTKLANAGFTEWMEYWNDL